MLSDSHIGVRIASVVIVSAMVLSCVLASIGRTGAHTGDWIDSAWTGSPPTIDGIMAAGEWSDAASADLGAIPGNSFQAYLLVKNDASFLYVAYDAVGDTTADPNDGAAVSFDTGHDVMETFGGESEFVWGPGANNAQEHLLFDGVGWSTEDSPFNTGLPNHAGLSGAFGYGPSDLSVLDHMIYELQIPLALLDVAPANVIGFLGASDPSPGVMDASAGYDCWPLALSGPPPLTEYGDLRMGRAPKAADLDLNPPSQTQDADPSSTVDYTITVENRGTANDVFEMQAAAMWMTDLYDSGGVNLLVDTDADMIPDTGTVGPGANVQIIARVTTPASGICDDALITGTSANDPATSGFAIVRTCLIGAALNPPHSDFGVDTDFPPNGLYDELWIDVGVMVNVDGFYDVDVDLYDPSDTFYITSDGNYTYIAPGSSVVSLFLPGLSIYNSGFDGQYVAYIYFYDDLGSLIDAGMYVTTSYMHTDFDGPDALLNPPHSDIGVDTDFPPNGLYDELSIDVGVMVSADGFYDIMVDLYDPSDIFFITSGYSYGYLSMGPQSALVTLQGVSIYNSGFDGQYVANIYLRDDFGNLLDSGIYVTSSYMHTDFDGPDALLNPPHSDYGMDTDSPPNGFFDQLWINVGIMVSANGYYDIGIDLYDPSDTFYITSGGNYSNLLTGPQTMSVFLEGLPIYGSGFDGQYVAYIYLHDDFGNLLDSGIYVTSSYMHTDFDGPGALFNPPHSDHGVDYDVPPNGLYDELVIDVGVTVTEAGTYAISGPLFDQFMNFVTFNSTIADLGIGNQVVPLEFSGLEIFMSGLDGPYTVTLSLSDLIVTLDSDTYTTGAYSCTDFDPLPGQFEPPHSDRGLDLTVPQDGLYEFLELDIVVNASKAATFEIGVELYDSTGMNYILTANAVVDLGLGLQTVPVRLDGLTIRHSGYDGPYWADLYLFSDSIGIDYDLYMTQPYLYSDFASEGAAFDPPYSDRIVDTDVPPDGLTDFLYIDVNIDVVAAGHYSVMALLVGMGSQFIEFTEVSQTLPVGVSPVAIPFDGDNIAESGVDGPYIVEMLLFDEYRRNIDMDMYITEVYAASQFEPSDVTAPVSIIGPISYWKNANPLLVPYVANDPSPTDGLQSTTLYYQYSADNSSWGFWTEYYTALAQGNPSVGTIPFTFPGGSGYYRFQTISVDAAGNQETLGAPEAEVAYLPLAQLRLQPDPLALSAGQQRTLTISILSTNGQSAILESPLTVNLDTWSPSGEYRDVSGSTPIMSVTIPAGSSSASVDYYDTAAGTWTLLGYTNGGLGGMGEASVIAGSVASITVAPAAASIEVNQFQVFTAIAEDTYGNRVTGATITWEVSGTSGTVDLNGRFTAGTIAQSGTITARSGTIQGTAAIFVLAGPAAQIRVSPGSVTIQSGTTVTLLAEIVDAYGNVVSSGTVAWSVSGPGTISPSVGTTTTVTANSAGTITVTATLGSLSGTATVTSVDVGGGGFSSMAVIGMAGGLVGGILVGFAIGWILHKRRSRPQQPAQTQTPPPPPANFPPAQPPQPPSGV